MTPEPEFMRELARAAVKAGQRTHAERMKSDPAYRARQQQIEEEWGKIFGEPK